MHLRRVPAGLRAGLIVLVLMAAACGDDGGDEGGGGLGALVTTTTEAEETTTTTEEGGGLFDDDGTGTPGEGLFGGDVDHDVDVDPDDVGDLDASDPFVYFGSEAIDVDLAAALDGACAGGDMQACDTLYLDTPGDTQAEAFGATCGGALPSADAYCVTLDSATTGSYVPLGSAFTGTTADDTEAQLVEVCGLGGMNACDALYAYAADGSPSRDYGATCGGRIDTTEWCTDLYSLGYGYHQEWLAQVGLAG